MRVYIADIVITYVAANPGCSSGDVVEHLQEKRGKANRANATALLRKLTIDCKLSREDVGIAGHVRFRYWATCPQCGRILDAHIAMNALSRYDNKTYICSPCGSREACETNLLRKIPNPKNLPGYCYSHNYSPSPETIMISYGMEGYLTLAPSMKVRDHKELNARLGITEEQADLMRTCSMIGWDYPGLQEESN